MKKILLTIFSLGLMFSCQSQNNKHMERFNIEDFNQHSEKGSRRWITADSTVIEEHSYAAGYARMEVAKNSLFQQYSLFYKNGNGKEQGLLFVRGNFQKGTWNYYDENGRLEKTVDYDQPFGFTYEDLAKYCRSNNIDLHESHTFIDKRTAPQPEWDITYLHNGKNRVVTLDGKTGKKLREVDQDIIR